jgi:hypothetical protein
MKNEAALEAECFTMLSHGAKVNVGDQLHPRGRLDPEVYRLIGGVFRRIEEREPWCRDAKPAADIGLVCVNDEPTGGRQNPGITVLEAASQMLLEQGAQFDIIDWEELGEKTAEKYRLLVFPDIVYFDGERERKVRAYLDGGGRALLTFRSGLTPDGGRFAPDPNITVHGESPYTATYLRIGEKLGKDLLQTDYVSYERGMNVTAGDGCEVLARVVEPYFERAWDHFMSHQQTPPDKLSPWAAAILHGRMIYFSEPLFISYKRHGNRIYKQLVAGAVSLLLGRRLVESDLPSTARTSVCDQENRRIVHILHYPVERRAGIDIIEDVIPLYNRRVEVQCDFVPSRVYMAPSGEAVDHTCADGVVTALVREIRGHGMLVLER